MEVRRPPSLLLALARPSRSLGQLQRRPAPSKALTRSWQTPQRSSWHFLRITALAAVAGRLSRGSRGSPKTERSSKEDAVVLIWHRTDLRTDDNPILTKAVELLQSAKAKSALPVYVIDPEHFVRTPFGSPKTGRFRAKFLLECLADLKKQLKALGSDLLILVGQAEEKLAELVQRTSAASVLTEQHVTYEELQASLRVQSSIEAQGANLREIWGNTLYHKDDLEFLDGLHEMPDVFTPFRQKVEKCQVRDPREPPNPGSLPLPAIDIPGLDFVPDWSDLPFSEPLLEPGLHERSAFTISGGEAAALSRLKHYVWDTDLVARYFETRNEMLGSEYSTKLSASLAHGCISPRRIRSEIQKYERQRQKNKSTYWVVFELIWRDFYRFFCAKHGNRVFQLGGTAGPLKKWASDQEALQRWKDGTTGWPLVDANMRELKETGFMSNRGRQNVASYLALDLGIDWRLGADHFESLLVDYDVTSNWGNWVVAAGLTGGRISKFNITKQANDYDSQGEYVRAWIPELSGLTGPQAHQPWKKLQDSSYPTRALSMKDVNGRVDGGGSGKAPKLPSKERSRKNRLVLSDKKDRRTDRGGRR